MVAGTAAPDVAHIVGRGSAAGGSIRRAGGGAADLHQPVSCRPILPEFVRPFAVTRPRVGRGADPGRGSSFPDHSDSSSASILIYSSLRPIILVGSSPRTVTGIPHRVCEPVPTSRKSLFNILSEVGACPFSLQLDLRHRGEVRYVSSLGLARALLQLAQIGAIDGHGCSEVCGLGSFWLAGRQAQARQEEFAVLRITPVKGIGHYQRCDSS